MEVIKEMTEHLKQNNIINDGQALLETLMEREKLGSTGIGENVAIPHGKSYEVTQIITIFARSLNGVDFESLDQKPAFARTDLEQYLEEHTQTNENPETEIKIFQNALVYHSVYALIQIFCDFFQNPIPIHYRYYQGIYFQSHEIVNAHHCDFSYFDNSQYQPNIDGLSPLNLPGHAQQQTLYIEIFLYWKMCKC